MTELVLIVLATGLEVAVVIGLGLLFVGPETETEIVTPAERMMLLVDLEHP